MPEASSIARRAVQTIMGPATLMRIAFDGHDLMPFVDALLQMLAMDPANAGAALDLATVLILRGFCSDALSLQEQALGIARHFGWSSNTPNAVIRVLAIVTAGDFMANTPLEYLLQDSRFALEFLFVQPGEGLPLDVPDHDILIVAVAYSRRNAQILREIGPRLDQWHRPVINRPAAILQTSRDGIANALSGIAEVIGPRIQSVTRSWLRSSMEARDAVAFPVLIRPLDSHAGNDLCKLECWEDLKVYLEDRTMEEFYLSEFCDYRSADGVFRKYRVALIEGRPVLAHLALRDTWMIHYLNAGMLEDSAKRAEEAKAMREFDEDFGRRHRTAFEQIHARVGLEYLVIDCAETVDGRLVVFEADTAMVVHDMDPNDIYPYKRPQMQKLFSLFQDLLMHQIRQHVASLR